jgi:hypothetical protein
MGRDMSMLMISQTKRAPKNTFLRSYEGGSIENNTIYG